MNTAEKLYERIKNPDVDDNRLELYILYIKTNKRDRPIANNRYGEDPPEDIKNALIENGKRTKEGKWTKEVLKKGCPFNFNDLNKDNCLNSTYNGMSITVDMLSDTPDRVRIFSLRSFGESLYDSLTDASLEFGYIGK